MVKRYAELHCNNAEVRIKSLTITRLGVPTGITQNVSPLLESPTARDMLQNCCFIEILAQAGPDRDRLQEILNLSNAQISYITNSPRGQGLLYTGKRVAA